MASSGNLQLTWDSSHRALSTCNRELSMGAINLGLSSEPVEGNRSCWVRVWVYPKVDVLCRAGEWHLEVPISLQ